MPIAVTSSQESKNFGFEKYPSNREGNEHQSDWIRAKRVDDDIGDETLWRVHNHVYDLKDFNHPGGQGLLEMSRGTDVTELFESSHPNISKAAAALEKYKVKSCLKPRNTRTFTFDKGGFYAILRSRVWESLKQSCGGDCGPTTAMCAVLDSLLILYLSSMAILCIYDENTIFPFVIIDYCVPARVTMLLLCAVSGLLLALLMMCAHNFFHQRDNWRMFAFDAGPYSSYEWRISHVYSHHAFPNTLNDFEVSAPEKILQFLPTADKTGALFLIRTVFAYVVVYGLIFFMGFLRRIVMIMTRKQAPRAENLLPFVLFTVSVVTQVLCSGGAAAHQFLDSDAVVQNIVPTLHFTYPMVKKAALTMLYRWAWVWITGSYFFHHISFATGHHHPDVWHAGDSIPYTINQSRVNRDDDGSSLDIDDPQDVAGNAGSSSTSNCNSTKKKKSKKSKKKTVTMMNAKTTEFSCDKSRKPVSHHSDDDDQQQQQQQQQSPSQASLSPYSIDWGIFQIITMGRYPGLDESLVFSSMTFGRHVLHHLFPTVDHSKLPLLIPALRQTCREFNIYRFDEDIDTNPVVRGEHSDPRIKSGWSWSMQKSREWWRKREFMPMEGWIAMIEQSLRSKPSADNFPPDYCLQRAAGDIYASTRGSISIVS